MKKYVIGLCEENEITRKLTNEQYELIRGIFVELCNNCDCSDNAPYIGITEQKIIVYDLCKTENGFYVWLKYAEDVIVGQKLITNFCGKHEYIIKELYKEEPHKNYKRLRKAFIVPSSTNNDSKFEICIGTDFETEY